MASDSQPNSRMYVAIATAMIGAIMFGIDCGNFGSVQGFRSFQEEWCEGNYGDTASCAQGVDGAAVNDKWLQDFVMVASVLLFVGAAVGSLVLAPSIADGYGRRPCIFIGAAVCFAGCLLTSYLAFSSIFVFFMGRFVTGFGIGVCTFALPLYNSEVSAPSIRGTTGALFQVNVVLGQLVAAIVTFLCHDWRVGMMLPGIAAVAVAGGVWLTPESPRYIMLKRGFKEGAEALAQVRQGGVDEEAKQVMQQLEEEASAGQVGWLDLARIPSLRTRVLIACWLQVAQQFTGINMLIMYSNTVFTEMGFSDPFAPNMAFTGVQIVGMIVGLVLLDSSRGGRFPQLVGVTLFICPMLFLMGASVQFGWSTSLELVFLCLFALAWQMAWGMIPWVYPSELFTMAERERCTSLAVFMQYASNAVLMIVVPHVQSAFGFAGMLYFFGAFNILNLGFVVTCIKETKGVPLEDIPKLFGASEDIKLSKKTASDHEVNV